MGTRAHMPDLRVWDAACLFANEVRVAARQTRAGSSRVLWKQATRAADSVGANIAEGCGRRTARDRTHFLDVATGSLRESQHHLRLCRDYDLLPERDYLRLMSLAATIRRMLFRLQRAIDTP